MKIVQQLSVLLLLVPCLANAQVHTDPSGNVGVGTTAPQSKLHIVDGAGGEQLRFTRGTGGLRFTQAYNLDNLYLYNNDASKTYMSWVANGNIGIGTSSPYKKLHIVGTSDVEEQIEVDGDGYASMTLMSNNKRWHWSKRPSYEGDALRLFYHDGSSWQSPYMSFATNGDVGIGASFPSAKLDIVGINANSTVLRVSGANLASNWFSYFGSSSINPDYAPRLVVKEENIAGLNSGFAIAAERYNGAPRYAIGTKDNTDISFFTNGNESVRLTNSGNVGIGTTNTNDVNYNLFVSKGIRTRKVKVDQANWPDYVFEPTYKLPTLQQVEAFIKTNKHLPDVPSAKEIEESGLDLGDNQAVLLKKIEEQMLYILELNKTQEALLKKLERLEKALLAKEKKN
jgi:hypothetical protein